jgi:hypothetical protein
MFKCLLNNVCGHPSKEGAYKLEIWRTFDSGFRYDSLHRYGGFCYLVLEGVIKDVTLMFYSGSGHMGGINTLVNYVIGSGTVLAFKICVMVQYNALCVIADFVKFGFEGRGFSQLLIFFEDMV